MANGKCQMTQAGCRMPSVICHLSCAICHVPSVMCHLSCAICHVPSVMFHVPVACGGRIGRDQREVFRLLPCDLYVFLTPGSHPYQPDGKVGAIFLGQPRRRRSCGPRLAATTGLHPLVPAVGTEPFDDGRVLVKAPKFANVHDGVDPRPGRP